MEAQDADSGVTLRVPSVTTEDLRQFRLQHFPHASGPIAFTVPSDEAAWDEPEEDDGLGYYADGVKRTLTEEQIAMFRHSEIQALLKERRLRQQLDESPSARVSEQEAAETPNDSVSSHESSKRAAPEEVESGPNGQAPSKKRKRKKKGLRKPSPAPEEEVTYRRLARELDEQKDVPVELEY